MFLQAAQELAPLIVGDVARCDDVAHDSGSVAVVRLRQHMDERQRHLAFAQIAADRFADRRRIADEIQQIVHQLKRDPEVEAVLAQRLLTLAADVAEHAANLRAPTEQVRRLAPDDVEVLFLVDVRVAILGELIQLALDHLQRHVAQHADDLERVVRQGHRHRLDVQIVAEQHRDVVAPARMHRQAPAPQVGVVDDVVVDQRGRVDEFDDGGVQHRPIALIPAQPRGHQQHGGPDTLSAARLNVAADLRDQIDLRLDMAPEFPIHLLEVGANRLEDLRQGRRRFFHSNL